MYKFKTLWLMHLFIPLFINAQTLTITDNKQNALEGVALISENPKAYTITNSKGQADISAFNKAENIYIRTLGYKPKVLSYTEISDLNFRIILEVSNLEIEEVVVSATRWRQNSGNIPSKIISIAAKEIIMENPQTAADLLGISGKVFIQKSQQGGGSPMIRGFSTNRLLYAVDGIRMNTAIFRSGNIQNVINLDPFAIENTEVLFGPGSVTYGSDAIGGVMSFQTLTPQFSLNDETHISGKTNIRYSSANNENTAHFDVNIGWKKFAILTSFSSWDFDHLRQGSNGPEDYIKDFYVQRQDSIDQIISQDDRLLQIPTAYSQNNLMQKIRFKPNKKWDFQYGFHFSETSPYGRYDRHNRIQNGTARYAEWYYGPQKWMMNNLSANHYAGNLLYDELAIRIAQQSFEESRISRSLNSSERSINTENVEAYSVNLDFNKQISERITTFYGLEYVLNDVNSEGEIVDISDNSSYNGAARYPNSEWSSMAAFIDNQIIMSEKFTLHAGLRYNYFNLSSDFTNNSEFYPFDFEEAQIENNAITGSFGGIFKPTNSIAIKANFGTAFRSPNADDIGKVFDSEPGAVVVPNPNLDAEYAYNFDLGIAKVFRERVKLDITAYYTILENALVRRDFQLNGLDSMMYDGQMSSIKAVQNAASANVMGIQASIEVKLPEGFSFTSDINYQDGEEEYDDGTTGTSRHSAPLFGSSRIRFKTDKLSLEFYSLYQAERLHEEMPESEKSKTEIYALDSDGNTYSPAWHTINIKAMYDVTEKLSVSSGIENLTDNRYRPYSSGISGAGRNFILSLQWKF